MTVTTIVSGRNLLTIALGSTQYEKGVPLKTRSVDKLKPLRTTTEIKDLRKKKKRLTTVRQAHFLPLAELGHEAFRLTGFKWCWISFIKHEDGKGSLKFLFYSINLLKISNACACNNFLKAEVVFLLLP